MAFFFIVAGSLYVIEESRRSTVIYASHEDKVLNKFGIWKERHVQMGENRASRLVGCKTHPTILPRSGFELTTSRTPQLQTWSKCPKLLTTRPRRNIVRSCHWTQSLYSCWQSLCKKIGYKLAKLTGHTIVCTTPAVFRISKQGKNELYPPAQLNTYSCRIKASHLSSLYRPLRHFDNITILLQRCRSSECLILITIRAVC